MQTFEVELPERLKLGGFFNRDLDPAVDQNLPVIGMRAQARAEIDHRAGCRIVEASLIADVSERRMAGRNTDAETELVAVATPLLRKRGDVTAHFNRHAHRPHRRIGTGN